MTTSRVGWTIALVCLLAGALLAQDRGNEAPNTRSVRGVVADSAGKPQAGAVVQLKDTKTLQIRSFYTQADGAYHFAGLSTNVDYELKAGHEGSLSAIKTLSTFDSRRVATIDLKLK